MNFGNRECPEIMAQLVELIEGQAETCITFDTPITGDRVSLYIKTLARGFIPPRSSALLDC